MNNVKQLGIVLLVLLALALVAVQCERTNLFGRDETDSQDVATILEYLIEQRHPDSEFIQVLSVDPKDVDGDAEDEWLAFYKYDPSRTENFENAPVQGLLYDVVTCEFPEFVSYELPTPDDDYLSESNISTNVTDFLDSGDRFNAGPELVVTGDAGTKRSILSIYRFRDTKQNPCLDPYRPREGLQLLGYFDANVRIDQNLDAKRITAWRRTAFERSQLAIRSSYLPINAPDGGETYQTAEGNLVSPEEQSVDFAFGLPISPSDSPYPEKAVAAFYLYMGVDASKSEEFLVEELQDEYPERNFGLPYPVEDVSEVLIYSITYQPDVEKERNREDREVRVTVLAKQKDDSKLAAAGTCTIVWRVTSKQLPPGEGVDATSTPSESTPSASRSNDLEWLLAGIVDVSGDSRCAP